jgi:RNA polymerase sigma-70 factor, ECF subfamily
MAAIEDRRSEAGDELKHLYEEHGGRVRAICLALLRDRDEADDAAQQVFLSALRSLQRGTVPRDAGAWLATISRHECWARARRPAAAPLHAGLHDVKAEDPSASALSRAELDETWRSVAALPGRQREVLLLREVRGLGYDELADSLRLSRASVRSLLTRARRTLRAQLERGAAVLTGGPLLNAFGRLFGDGSNPALSSVTRSAAVGLGAVAITGGVVVAPHLVAPSHAHRAPARATHPRISHRSPSVAAPTKDRGRSEDVVRTVETDRDRSSGSGSGSNNVGRHDGGHDGGTETVSSGSSGSSGSGSSGHDGGVPATSTSSTSSETSLSRSSSDGPGSGSRTTVTTLSSSDGGGSSGRDGSGSGGSDSGSSVSSVSSSSSVSSVSSGSSGGSDGMDGGGSGSN